MYQLLLIFPLKSYLYPNDVASFPSEANCLHLFTKSLFLTNLYTTCLGITLQKKGSFCIFNSNSLFSTLSSTTY